MDAYQPPPPYMRPPSGPPPPADPYYQYYQYPARTPVPPPTQPGGPPAWYPNQYHNPHSPSPPPQPPQQWGPPSSQQPPFNAGANGNSQFVPATGPPRPPPYPQANQEWGNQNWGYHQGHTSQANSNVEDWAVKAREWAAANEQPTGLVYQQYPTHGYQDVHQQAVPGVSYQQQFPVPATRQPERYQNYATGNERYPGDSSAGLSHQENLPTSSAIHQQEVSYSYSSVAGKEESGNGTPREVHIPVPDGGGPVRAEQQIQYAYGDQTAAQPSNLSDQPLQFASRKSSDYANVPNAWPSHAAARVVYPPIPSPVAPIAQHDSSMAMPPVSGHTMPPYGRFPPPNLQPVGPPYAYGTKPPIHPVTTFMDDSYAASSVPPKKAPVPNWLKEELLKKKTDLGRPSSGSFEEREYMDDDVLYKPHVKADQHEEKSPSKSSDEEKEEDEDEMDAARTTAINMEIKRILTEVLLKVTDELFDEIATKVINEDETMPKVDSVQHNHKLSSSLLSTADPLHEASAMILVSVEGGNKKTRSGSPADVLGLASYASDEDDTDTDADVVSNANADGDGVERLGMGSRNNVSQQPSSEKLPELEEMASAKLAPEVDVDDNSGKNCKPAVEEYSQMLGSRRKDDDTGTKISVLSASSGLDDDTSGSRINHPDRTDGGTDAILDEPHKKNFGLNSDCNLLQDSIKSYGKDLSNYVRTNRSRTDETKTGKEKVDSQNGSKHRIKEDDKKSAEKVKRFESKKKSDDLHVKKDSRDAEKPHITSSKEERGRKREKEKEEERSRHRKDSGKEKRRRSATSNGSSDDSIRRIVSPSPVRSRRKRSSPYSDESSDDSRRKSSSRRRNRSPSPERSKRRHVSSRSPHSKNSQHKHTTLYSSHDKSRSKRSRSRSPHRRHRAK